MKLNICTFALVLGTSTTLMAQTEEPATEAPAPAPAVAATQPTVEAPAADPGKIFIAARLGYAIPMGSSGKTSTGKDSAMSDYITGMIPIGLDLGYMVTPNVMLGLYGQYGFVSLKDSACTGMSCSGSDLKFGVQGQYHISPTENINPWVGVGVGYEIYSQKGTSGGAEISESLKGMEYLNLQGGADFKLNSAVGIGPFINFSVGQYSSMSAKISGMAPLIPDQDISQDVPSDRRTIHEWFTFGVRGAFKL